MPFFDMFVGRMKFSNLPRPKEPDSVLPLGEPSTEACRAFKLSDRSLIVEANKGLSDLGSSSNA